MLHTYLFVHDFTVVEQNYFTISSKFLEIMISSFFNFYFFTQLTGGLRNLSDAPSLRGEFVSSGILPRLASVFSDHMTCTDIVFNISRLLR